MNIHDDEDRLTFRTSPVATPAETPKDGSPNATKNDETSELVARETPKRDKAERLAVNLATAYSKLMPNLRALPDANISYLYVSLLRVINDFGKVERKLAEKQAEVDAAKLERDAADTRAVMWETGAKELDARLRRCETDNNRCHANITAERQRAEGLEKYVRHRDYCPRLHAHEIVFGNQLECVCGLTDALDAALAARPEEGKP